MCQENTPLMLIVLTIAMLFSTSVAQPKHTSHTHLAVYIRTNLQSRCMLQSIFYLCVRIPLVDILILYKPTHHLSIRINMPSFISCEKHELCANVAIRWGSRSQGKTKRHVWVRALCIWGQCVAISQQRSVIDVVMFSSLSIAWVEIVGWVKRYDILASSSKSISGAQCLYVRERSELGLSVFSVYVVYKPTSMSYNITLHWTAH